MLDVKRIKVFREVLYFHRDGDGGDQIPTTRGHHRGRVMTGVCVGAVFAGTPS